jgi:hypothetical protein
MQWSLIADIWCRAAGTTAMYLHCTCLGLFSPHQASNSHLSAGVMFSSTLYAHTRHAMQYYCWLPCTYFNFTPRNFSRRHDGTIPNSCWVLQCPASGNFRIIPIVIKTGGFCSVRVLMSKCTYSFDSFDWGYQSIEDVCCVLLDCDVV